MNPKQMMTALKKIATEGKIDVHKVKEMPVEDAAGIVHILIRNRQPVILEMFNRSGLDRGWLSSMGYLYQTTGKSTCYTFLHLAGQNLV